MLLTGRNFLGVVATALGIALIARSGVSHSTVLSERGHSEELAVMLERADLRSGDVILRRGLGVISNSVMAIDHGASYSHAGIIVTSGDSEFVIHAEPKSEDGAGYVVREPLSLFLDARRASAAAVYRVRPEQAQRANEAAKAAMRYARRSVPFDGSFDSSSSSAVYCTELVWRVYMEAGVDIAPTFRSRPTPAFLNGPVVFISDIQQSHSLRLLAAWSTRNKGKS